MYKQKMDNVQILVHLRSTNMSDPVLLLRVFVPSNLLSMYMNGSLRCVSLVGWFAQHKPDDDDHGDDTSRTDTLVVYREDSETDEHDAIQRHDWELDHHVWHPVGRGCQITCWLLQGRGALLPQPSSTASMCFVLGIAHKQVVLRPRTSTGLPAYHAVQVVVYTVSSGNLVLEVVDGGALLRGNVY